MFGLTALELTHLPYPFVYESHLDSDQVDLEVTGHWDPERVYVPLGPDRVVHDISWQLNSKDDAVAFYEKLTDLFEGPGAKTVCTSGNQTHDVWHRGPAMVTVGALLEDCDRSKASCVMFSMRENAIRAPAPADRARDR